jgi:hypothetical protein
MEDSIILGKTELAAIYFIDYYFKCCMVGQKCKINITGRSRYVI